MKSQINKIDQVLPQTQCGLCGHNGCLPYAKAITEGESILLCQPGGAEVAQKLKHITGSSEVIDHEQMEASKTPIQIVDIDLDACIGCTKCLDVCPTDAILGSHKALHRVIEDQCNGCELCIPVCPVDCMTMKPLAQSFEDFYAKRKAFKMRYEAKKKRQILHKDDYNRRHAKVKLKQKTDDETLAMRREQIQKWLSDENE